MTVTLTRDDIAALHTLANASAVTWAGSTMTISSTGGTWLAGVAVAASPGQVVSGSISVSVPAGSASGIYYAALVFQNAAGAALANPLGPQFNLAAGAAAQLTLPPASVAPAGTASVVLRINALSGGTAGRNLTEVSYVVTTTATADEILTAGVTLDLVRAVDVATSSGRTYVSQGSIGAAAGSLTYLVSTWAQLLALQAIYRAPAPVAISGEAGPLVGYTHYGLGTLRAVTERTISGQSPRWSVQLDTRAA